MSLCFASGMQGESTENRIQKEQSLELACARQMCRGGQQRTGACWSWSRSASSDA